MQVIQNDHILCVDIDETLILWTFEGPEDFKINGVPVRVHKEHIEQIKRFKARNQMVIAWSKGGSIWCKKAIELLHLEKYIDIVMCKPLWSIDDKSMEEVSERFYINNDYSPQRNPGKI